MIKVMVCTKDNYIISINVTGHDNYDEHGNDLVCASVSSIMFGLCNAVVTGGINLQHPLVLATF